MVCGMMTGIGNKLCKQQKGETRVWVSPFFAGLERDGLNELLSLSPRVVQIRVKGVKRLSQ